MSKDCYGLAIPETNADFFWVGETTSTPTVSFTFAAYIYAVMVVDFIVMAAITVALAEAGGAVPGAGVPASVLFAALSFVLFFNNNLFKIEVIEDFNKAWPRIVAAWAGAGLIVAAVALATRGKMPPDAHAVVVAYAMGLGLMMLERFGLAAGFKHLVRRGVIAHAVAVIGAPSLARNFSEKLEGNRFGARIAAIFDDQAAGGNAVDVLMAFEKTNRIDTVVVTLPMDSNDRLRRLVQRLSLLPANIRIVPGDIAMEMKIKQRFAPFGEIPGVRLMTIADRPIGNWGVAAKFLLDRGVALLALLFFGPLMLLCAAGIKLSSPGPVLFRQKRIGYKNEIFEVYKFRSMHLNACNTGKLTERNDPRIFKFGHIMRKLSLDELPQIFNVLKGDMSLVGPRPHMPEARAAGKFYFDVVSAYAYRHRVKPGITGWAQVCGWRGPTETVEQIENRVAHDLFYIDNWSFSFDLLILVKTVFVGFVGKNAF